MHIEPGLVADNKIWLSYVTAAGAGGYALKSTYHAVCRRGLVSTLTRSGIVTGLVLSFFEVLPHYPVGISEVHLILGSTLFLIFGAAPAGLGLALGLLVQGLSFAPFDLPQYGMNVTTLLVPLFALGAVAGRIIAPDTPYVALTYRQAVALSTAYQAGIISWVAFWAFYGQGFTAANTGSIVLFAGAYALVIVVEPLIDLAVLAAAKSFHALNDSGLVETRLYQAA